MPLKEKIKKEHANEKSLFCKLNEIFDFFIKFFSLSFILGVLIGFIILYKYFTDNKIEQEIYNAVSAPQTLVVLALFSFLFAMAIISTMLIGPYHISQFSFQHEKTKEKLNNRFPDYYLKKTTKQGINVIIKNHIISSLVIYFYPLASFFIIFYSKASPPEYFMILPFISFSVTVFFYFHTTNESETLNEKRIKTIPQNLLILMFGHLCLLYPLIFIIELAIPISSIESNQILIIFLAILIYSVFSTIIRTTKLITYIPSIIISLFLMIFSFSYHIPENLILRSGLGAYNSNFYLKPEYCVNLNIEVSKNGQCELRNVYVISVLPNKIIIKRSIKEQEIHSIPSSAIFFEKRTPDKQKLTKT